MARIDATAAKTAVGLAAVQLTTLLQDDTLEELFNDYKQAHHPMRTIENMFLLDPATGVVTANDVYIDAAYDGNYPNSGRESGRESQGEPTPITLTTATIETAAAANIVLTFSEPIFDNQNDRVSIGGAAGALKAISSIAYAGAVVTVTMDSDFEAADVATATLRLFGNRGYIDLVDQAITNNIS